jgi:hypothetical protein
MRTVLSDMDLIESYIQRSIHHQDVFLANQTLQARSEFGGNQLLSKKEGLLAKFQVREQVPEFQVRQGISLWNMLNQLLAKHQFIFSADSQDNLSIYQPIKIPSGYQMHCDQAMHFWKVWWKYRNRIKNQHISMDLVVRVNNTWYPVKNVVISNGCLFVKTLASETMLDTESLMVWLEKISTPEQPATIPNIAQGRLYSSGLI